MKKKKLLTTLFILILFINSSVVFAQMPEFSDEEGVYLIEENSQDIILNNSSEEKINSGDMNKLMAVLVSLDVLGQKLSDKVIVGEEINDINVDDQITGFQVGQEVSYQDLLSAILLTGSSDATQILATNIGNKIKGESKSDGSDYLNSFLNKMNEKAKELNLKNTNYTNVIGVMDDENVSSIEDMTKLSQNVFSNESVKKVLSSEKYTIKSNSKTTKTKSTDETSDKENEDIKNVNDEESENNKTTLEEIPSINLVNEFLPILTTEQITEDSKTSNNEIEEVLVSEEDSLHNNEKENEESKSQTKDDSESSDTTSESDKSVEENKEQKTNQNNKNFVKNAFIANEDSNNPIIVFESEINDAKIIGCVSGLGIYTLSEQINSINNELASNYTFKDLVDESGIIGTYAVTNTSIFSKKKLEITPNNSLKVYVPKTDQNTIKTNIVWDKNIVNQEGDNYTLVQSIEPGTQVAQLEISKGDVKRLVPLYSSTKANIRNWKDSILTFIFWTIIILIPLLLFWRIIYVRNKKRAIMRRRALKKKKMMQKVQQKKAKVIESSPIDRMAHNL